MHYTEKPSTYLAAQWDGSPESADAIVEVLDLSTGGTHTHSVTSTGLELSGVYTFEIPEGYWVVSGPQWGTSARPYPVERIPDAQFQARFNISE